MKLAFFSNEVLNCFDAPNTKFDGVCDANGGVGVFFDRDGVINVDVGYLAAFDRSLIYDNFIECLKFLLANGVKTGVATNQSGVARGFYSWDDFGLFHRKLNCHLAKLCLPPLDAVACSWHPDIVSDRCYSNWRKPGPNMLLFLCCLNGVNPKNCIFIGDNTSDVEAAVNAKFNSVIKVDDVKQNISQTIFETRVITTSRDQVLRTLKSHMTKENLL